MQGVKILEFKSHQGPNKYAEIQSDGDKLEELLVAALDKFFAITWEKVKNESCNN